MKSSRLVCITLSISVKVLLNLSAWAKREGLVIQNTSSVSAHTIFVIVLRTAISIRSIWSKTSWRNSLSNSYRLTAPPNVLPLLYLCSDLGTFRKVQITGQAIIAYRPQYAFGIIYIRTVQTSVLKNGQKFGWGRIMFGISHIKIKRPADLSIVKKLGGFL